MAEGRETGQRLHVLIANEQPARVEHLESIVRALGHDVVAREIDPGAAVSLTREHAPDIALVGVGGSDEHALALIETIAREATCPVIAVLHAPDPVFVGQAARRGIFAHVTQDDPDELQSAIEVVLQRFAAFRDLQGAFGRRALIERAKGILMERHHVGEREAFELLRSQSRRTGRKLADIAAAVNDTHLLLPTRRAVPGPGTGESAAGDA